MALVIVVIVAHQTQLSHGHNQTTSTNAVEPHQPMETQYTKTPDEELKTRLTPLQCRVTQQEGTEPPFHDEYNEEHREGI